MYGPSLSDEASAGRQLSFIILSHSNVAKKKKKGAANPTFCRQKKGFSIFPKYTLTELDGDGANGPVIGPQIIFSTANALGRC